MSQLDTAPVYRALGRPNFVDRSADDFRLIFVKMLGGNNLATALAPANLELSGQDATNY